MYYSPDLNLAISLTHFTLAYLVVELLPLQVLSTTTAMVTTTHTVTHSTPLHSQQAILLLSAALCHTIGKI